MRTLRFTLLSSIFLLAVLLISSQMMRFASPLLVPEKGVEAPKTDYEPALQIGRGDIQTIEWQPNNEDELLISTARGTWIYELGLDEKAATIDAGYATYSPDGGFIAGVKNGQQIQLWNAVNFDALDVLYTHEHPVTALAWSPAGNRIASLDTDGRIIIHTLGSEDQHLWLPDGVAIEWSPGGTRFAARDKNGKVIMWDAMTWEVIGTGDRVYTSIDYGGQTGLTSTIIGQKWLDDERLLVWGIEPYSEFQDRTIANYWTVDDGYSSGYGQKCYVVCCAWH